MVLKRLSTNYNIIELKPSQWLVFKDFRLTALQIEPVAFKLSHKENSNRSDKEWKHELIASAKGTENKIFFVRYENKLVGMLGVRFDQTEKRRHVAYIYEVYIEKQYRGLGLGKKLFTFAISYIKKYNKKIKKIQLSVTASQAAALKMYQRFGFNVIGYERKEKKVGRKYYDQLLMEKLFI